MEHYARNMFLLPTDFEIILRNFWHVRKIAKSDFWRRHIRLSVRMEQTCSHSTDSDETRFMSIFRKSIEKIQALLNSANNDGFLAWRW
jgi:hypothetical protein